jgi:hypothetical protein
LVCAEIRPRKGREGKGRGGPNTPEPVSISMEGKKARIK